MENIFAEDPAKRRARAEMAIRALYRGAGFAPPARITWFLSPLAMTDAAMPKTAGLNIKTSLRHAWLDTFQRTAAHPLAGLFRNFADEGPVLPVVHQLRRDGAEHVNGLCHYWNDPRLVDFFNLFVRDSLGLRDQSLMQSRNAHASNLQFILPHELVCYASDSPVRLHADGGGRLHCPDGPAAVYGDGWKVYAVEGHWMPAYMMEHASQLAKLRQTA